MPTPVTITTKVLEATTVLTHGPAYTVAVVTGELACLTTVAEVVTVNATVEEAV